MIDVIGILFIVFGILQIILFFKLWGMTNDVRKLKNQFVPDYSFFEIRKNIVLGNTEKVKDLIISNFFRKIEGNEYPIEKAKEELEKDLKRIGEEIPENLKKINSYKEFYDLFW